MKKKAIFILFLVFAICLSYSAVYAADSAPEHGSAIDSGKVSSGTWTLYEDGTLIIDADSVGYYSNRRDVPWYDVMDRIVHVELNENITTLSNYVFCDATALETINLPEGLTEIGLRAFSNCGSLQSVSFPDSLEKLDYWSFSECKSLREICLGSSMQEIPNYAFQNCSGLVRAIIKAPTSRLGYDVLENCLSLTELYLPSSLTLIDQYALNMCPSLKDIFFEGTEEEWNRIQVEKNNACLQTAQIHFQSSYDPDTARPLEELISEIKDLTAVSVNNWIQIAYPQEEMAVFRNSEISLSLMDYEIFKQLQTYPETVLEALAGLDGMIVPVSYPFGEAFDLQITCYDFLGLMGNDLTELMETQDPLLTEFTEFCNGIYGKSPDYTPQTQQLHGNTYLIYDPEEIFRTYRSYTTLKNGVLIRYELHCQEGYEDEAVSFAEDAISCVIYQ